jgi:hypothetical protein
MGESEDEKYIRRGWVPSQGVNFWLSEGPGVAGGQWFHDEMSVTLGTGRAAAVRSRPYPAVILWLSRGVSIVRYLSSSIAFACAIVCTAPAAAQTTLTATFNRGAIAEYTNGPNGTSNAALFSSLGISSMTISQLSGNGSWGGTQGNDTSVTARITFTNGTTTTFPAAINWVKNAGGGQFDWIGLTIGAGQTVSDGYNLTPGSSKTYVLQFSSRKVASASQPSFPTISTEAPMRVRPSTPSISTSRLRSRRHR